MTCQPYAQLVDIKRWADRGLYEAAARNLDQLSEQDTHLLLRVLDHIHVVDRIFQHHLLGHPHTFQAPRSEALPDFQTLAAGVRAVDDWYAGYASALTKAEVDQPVDFVFTSGKPARMRRGEVLLHVCLHGTYHRGNAGALLQLRGLAPSRDSITDYLEDAA
jgi:uncharacterized damage-inducible protein DinB